MKLYRNWIINEVARAGEHTNERTYVRTYVLTYIRTGQTLYPLHNFVVRGDNNKIGDLYVQLLWEFELICKSHLSITCKKSVIVACFFVSDRLSAINYDNKTTTQILLPVLTLLCHFKFLLLLAMSL